MNVARSSDLSLGECVLEGKLANVLVFLSNGRGGHSIPMGGCWTREGLA